MAVRSLSQRSVVAVTPAFRTEENTVKKTFNPAILYNESLKMYPLRTKIITAVVLMATGDAVAQYYEKKDKEDEKYDKARAARMMLVAGSWSAVSMHYVRIRII